MCAEATDNIRDSPAVLSLTLALSHRAEDSPQNNACTEDPLSLEGEGWGEGKGLTPALSGENIN